MDQIFLTINAWMTSGDLAAGLGCLLWGAASVIFSPCHLASIPLIIGYVGGQNELVQGRRAALYSILFTFGLFITIALIGTICALLGRMLGDIGPWWTIPIGLVLIWVALDMTGLAKCSPGGAFIGRIKLRGPGGALILGLAYGLLSGACTFGFIAPILAVVTVQKKILTGIIFIVLFGIGHCLPIVLAGCSSAWVGRVLADNSFNRASRLFRKLAGITVGLLGLYFAVKPFLGQG